MATEAEAQSPQLHGPCPDTQQVAALTTYSEIQAYPGTTWPKAHTAHWAGAASDPIPALEVLEAPSYTPAVSLSKRPCVVRLSTACPPAMGEEVSLWPKPTCPCLRVPSAAMLSPSET